MAETTEFNGRRILVTGGTRGIGRAIVDRLIRGGGAVCLAADHFCSSGAN
jgi:NAD(P)-dependent dehydrogenase (short-subunit alcohol dehydrogenase family)